jgi:hypothetical protein
MLDVLEEEYTIDHEGVLDDADCIRSILAILVDAAKVAELPGAEQSLMDGSFEPDLLSVQDRLAGNLTFKTWAEEQKEMLPLLDILDDNHTWYAHIIEVLREVGKSGMARLYAQSLRDYADALEASTAE